MRVNLKKICEECGTAYTSESETLHRRSKWHRIAWEVRNLRGKGMTYAEIARRFNLGRSYIRNRLHEEGV